MTGNSANLPTGDREVVPFFLHSPNDIEMLTANIAHGNSVAIRNTGLPVDEPLPGPFDWAAGIRDDLAAYNAERLGR